MEGVEGVRTDEYGEAEVLQLSSQTTGKCGEAAGESGGCRDARWRRRAHLLGGGRAISTAGRHGGACADEVKVRAGQCRKYLDRS